MNLEDIQISDSAFTEAESGITVRHADGISFSNVMIDSRKLPLKIDTVKIPYSRRWNCRENHLT
ncbi:MAG: hypothetical protein R6V06_09085 [Kiritimatiellia bacterium]